MFVLFRGYDNDTYSTVGESILGMFRMSLGAFGEIYETFDDSIDDPVYKWFPQVGQSVSQSVSQSCRLSHHPLHHAFDVSI